LWQQFIGTPRTAKVVLVGMLQLVLREDLDWSQHPSDG